MGIHIPTVPFLGVSSKKRPLRNLLRTGQDIQLFGILLILTGIFDLIWIAAYPHYSLKIFGTTFRGWAGEFVKYQHPAIHWILGYGFFKRHMWAF